MFRRISSLITNTEIIGIDIGAESIKMAEITHENGYKLNTFGIAKHNLDLEGYWNGKTLRSLSKSINKVLNEGSFEGVKSVLSVRSKDVYVTTMDFAIDLNKAQIEREIKDQSPYFLPYPPDEMRLSWSFLGEHNGKKRVIINALPEFSIKNAKNLLEHTNLDGIALENQTLSQIRSIIPDKNKNYIIVDVGSSHTVMSMIIKGSLRSTTFIDIGTASITHKLAHKLGVEDNIGEYFKKELSLINLNKVPKTISDYVHALDLEIQNYINLNNRIGQKADGIIMTGGGIYTAGLLDYFSEYIINVEIGNPFLNLDVEEEVVPYISPVLSQLSTAIGLAKRKK